MKSIPLTENELKHIRETYELELEKLQKRTGEISGILKKLKGTATEDAESEERNTVKEVPRKNVSVKKEKDTPKTESIKVKADTKVKGKRGRPPKAKVEAQTKTNEIVAAEKPAPKKRGRKPSLKKDIEKTAKAPSPAKAIKALKKSKVEVKPLKAKKAVATVKNTEPKKRGRKPSDNSKKARWTASILDILNKGGKVLSSREIIGQVMKLQNIPAAELQKTRSIITGSLSDLKLETKKVKTMTVSGKKGELYGLSQWFNELGQLVDPSRL